MILFNNTMRLRICLLRHNMNRLTLPRAIVRAPNMFHLRRSRRLMTIPFKKRRATRNIQIFISRNPNLLRLSFFRIISIRHSSKIMTNSTQYRPSFPMINHRNPRKGLLLSIINFLRLSLHRRTNSFSSWLNVLTIFCIDRILHRNYLPTSNTRAAMNNR